MVCHKGCRSRSEMAAKLEAWKWRWDRGKSEEKRWFLQRQKIDCSSSQSWVISREIPLDPIILQIGNRRDGQEHFHVLINAHVFSILT